MKVKLKTKQNEGACKMGSMCINKLVKLGGSWGGVGRNKSVYWIKRMM